MQAARQFNEFPHKEQDMYAVIVDFKIKPEHAAAFREVITSNARASVADEPGCSLFDVCVDPQDGTQIFLYEIYDNLAAFEAHLRTPHYAVFDKVSAPMVETKTVRKLSRICP